MRRFALRLSLVALGALAATLLLGSSTSQAGPGGPPFGAGPGPLLSCPDVDGNTQVTIGDILGVATSFGSYPSEQYLYLHDVGNGDGSVTIGDDILYTASRFGESCTDLIDQQVALATQATIKYRDCQDALADGYVQSTQFVPNMGIHLSKIQNVTNYPDFYSGSISDPNDQLRNPGGLICTDSDPDPNTDVPDRLIGMWYVVPNLEACSFYGNPPNCDDAEPVGFGLTDSDEDNIDVDSLQKAWHTHPGLCVWGVGTTQAGSGEGFSETGEDGCDSQPQPSFWFQEYGWMIHLYNFIPNQDGRFLMWSDNVPGEGQ